MTSPQREALLVITNAPMSEPRFTEQKDAVKATGAQYQKATHRWTLEIDLDNLPVKTINTLFTIAREYGTEVKLIAFQDGEHAHLPDITPS